MQVKAELAAETPYVVKLIGIQFIKFNLLKSQQ
jgi:hypothetical protein